MKRQLYLFIQPCVGVWLGLCLGKSFVVEPVSAAALIRNLSLSGRQQQWQQRTDHQYHHHATAFGNNHLRQYQYWAGGGGDDDGDGDDSKARLSSAAAAASSTTTTTTTTTVATTNSLPRLQESHMRELATRGYVVIPDFIDESWQAALREDVQELREKKYFAVAKIGQDTTNALNRNIRVAETCFFPSLPVAAAATTTTTSTTTAAASTSKNNNFQNHREARWQLQALLQQIPQDLMQHAGILRQPQAVTKEIPTINDKFSEFLYAYYPRGGFYRRHVDALPGSASVLRCYSLLLYLNDNDIWQRSEKRGGQLRLHFDSGRNEMPQGEEPNFVDIEAFGGTLVLLDSHRIPHEVLDTNLERLAVVGWYNRAVRPSDVWTLNSGSSNAGSATDGSSRLALLAVSATLILVGLFQLTAG